MRINRQTKHMLVYSSFSRLSQMKEKEFTLEYQLIISLVTKG